MKFPVFWVFFFVVGAALVAFTFFSSSSIPGMEFLRHSDSTRVTGISRKLKEIGDSPINGKQSNVDIDDYQPIDPVPSSKASIKPGPIEHGSPLNPFIPKPPPPDNPKIGGST